MIVILVVVSISWMGLPKVSGLVSHHTPTRLVRNLAMCDTQLLIDDVRPIFMWCVML